MRRHAASNVLKALLLVAMLALVFAAFGWVVSGSRGGVLFAFSSLLAASAVYAYGDRALLGMLGARPFALAEDPLLRSTTDRIASALRVARPKLYVIDDGFPRAFVVGRGRQGATLAVSTGLLHALTPAELEAVIAHEIAHVRLLDVLTQTFAVLLSTTLVEMSRLGGWLSRGLLAVLAPVGAAFTHALLSPRRELAADAMAASVVDPHDLADALVRLDQAAELVDFVASPATEPLYVVDPFDHRDRLARMFATHPALQERVALLRGAGSGASGAPAAGEETTKGP